MKKVKRIIALVGVIALVALYVSTLVLAIIGSEQTMSLFLAAVVSTVILPVLIWAYSFIYQLIKKNYSNEAIEKKLKQEGEQKND